MSFQNHTRGVVFSETEALRAERHKKPISALDFRYLSPTGRNLGLMGKLKINSELLTPLDYWNLAWTNRANLGKLEN